MLLLKRGEQLSNRDYCWGIYSRDCTACPLLSQPFCRIMALSRTVSEPLFKYLWKQLTEQCQCSSRWLMRGQDQASRTMEPPKASWTWHSRTEGEVKDRKHVEVRARSVQKLLVKGKMKLTARWVRFSEVDWRCNKTCWCNTLIITLECAVTFKIRFYNVIWGNE